MASDLNAILEGYFGGGTPPAALYIGLVAESNFSAFTPATDEMDDHPGWEEFEDYEETTRQLWEPGVVLGSYPARVNNPRVATITPTDDAKIVGVFFCDDDTIGGTTGQLYGPWFFDEGARDAFTGSPFDIDVTINLKSNTPTAT